MRILGERARERGGQSVYNFRSRPAWTFSSTGYIKADEGPSADGTTALFGLSKYKRGLKGILLHKITRIQAKIAFTHNLFFFL